MLLSYNTSDAPSETGKQNVSSAPGLVKTSLLRQGKPRAPRGRRAGRRQGQGGSARWQVAPADNVLKPSPRAPNCQSVGEKRYKTCSGASETCSGASEPSSERPFRAPALRPAARPLPPNLTQRPLTCPWRRPPTAQRDAAARRENERRISDTHSERDRGVRTKSWTTGRWPGWTGQGFLDRKISFFSQHLALGRTGRYSRSMSASSACCSRARCI